MLWPFPNKDSDPWFDEFESMVTFMDSSGYAAREDRNIIFSGGGDVSWDAGSSTLTWDDDFIVLSLIAGYKLTIPAGSTTVADGQIIYANVTRAPTQNATLGVGLVSNVPNTDSAMAIAVRIGTEIYWRWGVKLIDGETANLFGALASNAIGDVYERAATFGVPIGASSDEATVGRAIYPGSIVALSAELTIAMTAGTITINVKVNGTTQFTLTLTSSDPPYKQVTFAPGVYPIGTTDQISIEVIGAAHNNAPVLPAGLTLNIALASGLIMPATAIPDASTATKGLTRLSVAPVLASQPIAVGDNDTRISVNRRFIRTIVQPADGSDFNVTISPPMPNTNYIVTHTLGTVAAHVTVSVPTASRTTSQFNVKTSAAMANGETIYFHVVEI
jgi:hypothetical protein